MDNMDKKMKYIKNSIYFNLQKKEISELMSKSIKKSSKYKLKLINKDIINGYLNDQLNEEINSFLNKENKKASEFNDQDINNIIYYILNNGNNKKSNSIVEELAIDFLFPEEMKVNNLEFPTNFYIIAEERFNKIFENKNNLTDFKTYDAYLGDEVIFMWIEGVMITSESENENQAKEYKKAMYYIENNDDLKVNKIFLFKNEEELNAQLEIINKIGKEGYFTYGNVIKTDLGSYNMINDGKIIGKYINIIKNLKESNIQMQNSVIESNDNERIESEISRIEEKEELIEIFLPYLIICFTKIEKLKKGLEENSKDIKGILKSLSKIINSVNNNKINDISKNITNFVKDFLKKDFIINFSYSIENKIEAFKNLIEMLLNEFHQEIYLEDKLKPRKTFEEFKNSTFIFNLFFGLKIISKKETFFNTIELDTTGTGNQNVKIEDLLIHYKFRKEELVTFFPNVLILLIRDDGNLLKLPLEFNLKYDNKDNNKYKLKSCIQLERGQFFSFIINENNNDFYKICFYDDKNQKFLLDFENSNIDEINEKMTQSSYNICFYEINDSNNDYNSEETTLINNNINNQFFNNNNP